MLLAAVLSSASALQRRIRTAAQQIDSYLTRARIRERFASIRRRNVARNSGRSLPKQAAFPVCCRTCYAGRKKKKEPARATGNLGSCRAGSFADVTLTGRRAGVLSLEMPRDGSRPRACHSGDTRDTRHQSPRDFRCDRDASHAFLFSCPCRVPKTASESLSCPSRWAGVWLTFCRARNGDLTSVSYLLVG